MFSRQQKSIPVSEPMRRALGIDDAVTDLTPPNLIRAILRAPVDLLFNGGIGTYIKPRRSPTPPSVTGPTIPFGSTPISCASR